MAIPVEIRHKKVKDLEQLLKKEAIAYEYLDTNELRIFLSDNRNNYLDVDLTGNEEYYTFKGKHNFSRKEIHVLQRVMLLINDTFSPDPTQEPK